MKLFYMTATVAKKREHLIGDGLLGFRGGGGLGQQNQKALLFPKPGNPVLTQSGRSFLSKGFGQRRFLERSAVAGLDVWGQGFFRFPNHERNHLIT